MPKPTYEQVHAPDNDDLSNSENEYDGAQARTSGDVRRVDQETLTAEEEAERLLSGENGEKRSWIGNRSDAQRRESKRLSRRQRRRRKKGEESSVMYEMEEGGLRSSSAESSGQEREMDMRRLGEVQARQKSSKAKRFSKFAAIHLLIIAAFIALLYGAYKATGHHNKTTTTTSSSNYTPQSLSNGTHTFAPTTLLISLDGFRADFLSRGLTPTLNAFIREGVSPKYMTPSFPSLTFPNHFTLATGLHPESHGVVGNTFFDPITQKEFYYTDPDRSMQPEWWNAEPLWLTAELAGVRTAIHMWPGSEAHIGSMEPAYVDEFNADEKLERKVDRILHWLDLPGPEGTGAKADTPRPQLIAAYVPNVDADGHKYGPNSTYIRSTIAEVDGMLGSLFAGIAARNLTNIVNIIVVSDHGMATTSTSRLIQLEDLLDTSQIEHTDGWPLYGLRPYNTSASNLEKIYTDLSAKAALPKYKHAFDVYLRDKNMPPRYHFTSNPRIAPLWIVPGAGWAIVTRDEFDVQAGLEQGLVYMPRGLHGYDHEHPLMRAIFVAKGPAFPHPAGSRVGVFGNVEVYNVVCDSLGLVPKGNNGTLRLPLKTVGTHDFSKEVEVPDDLQGDDKEEDFPPEVPNLAPTGFPTMPKVESGSPLPPIPPLIPVLPDEVEEGKTPERPVEPDHPEAPKRPVVHDDDIPEPEGIDRFWEWVKGKLDAIKWWADEQHADTKGDSEKGGKDGQGEKGGKNEKGGKSGKGGRGGG